MNGKEVIEKIKEDIIGSKSMRIYDDFTRTVSLIAELIFNSPSHFLIEIIQNAEDAGFQFSEKGEMEIRVSKNRVLIIHNAKPFDENDVDAICGVRSTKKPEAGTLGYIGIGFKSVFKITDCPHIFSGKFKFKFDKKEWENPSEVPWQIIPIWVDDPPEGIELKPTDTVFYLPFRDEKVYEDTKKELKALGLNLYFFLRWLKKIKITDEVCGEDIILENLREEKLDEKSSIITLRRKNKNDDKCEKYLVFKRTVEVPPDIAKDNVTKAAQRSNVKKREVMVAFRLDDEDNLIPLEIGKTYGGVYSFLPLGEEKSGARYLIQADFIVNPGRESINYEAKWNHWLMKEITELLKESVEVFLREKRWRKQFLPLFDFDPRDAQNSFEKLFRPQLHAPLMEYLKQKIPGMDNVVGNIENGVWIKDNVYEILTMEDIKKIFPNKSNPFIIEKDTQLGRFEREIDWLNALKIAGKENFLQQKAKEPNAVEWFYALYSIIYTQIKNKQIDPKKLNNLYVLTENFEIKQIKDVFLQKKFLKPEVIELKNKYPEVAEALKSYPFLHPELENKLSEFFENEEYLSFKKLDYAEIFKKVFLPKICEDNQLEEKELIAYTRLLKESEVSVEEKKIRVLTKDGKREYAYDVFFSSEYFPKYDLEKNKDYLPRAKFLSPKYIEGESRNEIGKWREFFRKAGVREELNPKEVEEFGINFVLQNWEKLKKRMQEKFGYYFTEIPEKEVLRGCDFICKTNTGKEIYIEVKSKSEDTDVELTPSETEYAEKYKDCYLLCIVTGIPKFPELYMVPDPLNKGKKEKLIIPKSAWKQFKYYIEIN